MSKNKKKERKRFLSGGNVNPGRYAFNNHDSVNHDTWTDRMYNLCFQYFKMTIERLYRIYCCVKEFAREHFYGLMVTIMLSVILTVQQGQINYLNNTIIHQGTQLRSCNKRILENQNDILLLQTISNAAYTKQQNINRRIQNKVLENENGIRILENKLGESKEFTKHEFQKFDIIDAERVKMMERLAEEMEKINEETTQLHKDIRTKTDSFFAKVNSMKKDENEFAKEKDSYHNQRL